jgi:hypothetical protein
MYRINKSHIGILHRYHLTSQDYNQSSVVYVTERIRAINRNAIGCYDFIGMDQAILAIL